MASTSVDVRSVSPRTVFARANAMAESAAASHKTASSALPRVVLFAAIIVLQGIARDMDRDCERHELNARRIRIEGRHLDANHIRQEGLVPMRHPDGGHGGQNIRLRENEAITEVAVGQLVGE